MKKEDIKVKSQYFKRSYFALDGLWFMMVEKYFSLEDALKIDEEVWKILPKIQAREVRRLLNLKENTLQNFIQALEVKLEVEDYQYQKKITGPRLCFLIKKCPWYEIIKKSRREYLLLKGICQKDFGMWPEEFHLHLRVRIDSCICGGDSDCKVCFIKSKNSTIDECP